MNEDLVMVVSDTNKVYKGDVIEELRNILDNLHYYNTRCVVCDWIECTDNMKRCSQCKEKICSRCIKRTVLNNADTYKYICSDCNQQLKDRVNNEDQSE
jgi:uncharacterized CHY-type Zn-finger protein